MPPDPAQVWTRILALICEEFPPEQASGRARRFLGWFSRSFMFGHTLHTAARGAHDLVELNERAERFLANAPKLAAAPGLTPY